MGRISLTALLAVRIRILFVAVALAGSAPALSAAPQSPIAGKWINPSRSVIIRIAPCGHALCGTVTWASAKAKRDARKGTQSLVGTQLLTGLQQQGSQWEGRLFVPDRNVHVEAKIEPAPNRRLKVSGCALFICDSQLWTRSKGKP